MAPKPRRSVSPSSRFLFVNEDASSVTRTTKDAELDRTKQSHVQRQNFARKRRLREQSTTATRPSRPGSSSQGPAIAGAASRLPPATREGPAHGSDPFDFIYSVDPIDPVLQSSILLQEPLYPHFSASPPDIFGPASPSTATALQREDIYDVPWPYRPGQPFDTTLPPQNVTPLPIITSNVASSSTPFSGPSYPLVDGLRFLERWAPPLIQYYNTTILPEKFWKDTRKVPMSRIRHASSVHADMQACMAEPAHMYAFLASSATQMLAREGRLLLPDASEGDHQRVLTFFKTKAIQALMTTMTSGRLDPRTAIDVHRLYGAGIHADNNEMAEPHFQALISMLEALGGLDAFSDYEAEKMILLDCNAALKDLEAPRLLETWDPGPLTDDVLVAIESQDLHVLQAGSRVITTLAVFHDGRLLFQSFYDLTQVVKMSAHLESVAHYDAEHYKWFSLRLLAIQNRLLSLPLHCQMDSQTDSLRISLALWTATTRSPALARRIASKSSHKLRGRLESTDLHHLWTHATDLLLWVVVYGGVSAGNKDDLDWFVNIARGAAVQLGLRDFLALEDLLSGFLYDPYSQHDSVVHIAALMWPMSS
ncbi:hypothetical protein A1O1_04738 [Capronia coronata CBS 617.96]|uniref:Transcription factor domain-containing protein n=1 Tax=Capronia coronata CBS 617.96 TaxID=1182541 RepID=W9YEX1_9EURO|nr:uncharacterized protein A1O1_04738 [Capronia coronata CBS 617.96]EXJ87811.1 hypothetical protein A1O1_04738 [Capronia coronata CBS 617.96]